MDPKAKRFMCIYRPTSVHSIISEAERGDVEAQAKLGRLYFEGRPQRGTSSETRNAIMASFTPAFEQNLAAAVKWLSMAARQGHPESKRLLATIIAKGQGVH